MTADTRGATLTGMSVEPDNRPETAPASSALLVVVALAGLALGGLLVMFTVARLMF